MAGLLAVVAHLLVGLSAGSGAVASEVTGLAAVEAVGAATEATGAGSSSLLLVGAVAGEVTGLIALVALLELVGGLTLAGLGALAADVALGSAVVASGGLAGLGLALAGLGALTADVALSSAVVALRGLTGLGAVTGEVTGDVAVAARHSLKT